MFAESWTGRLTARFLSVARTPRRLAAAPTRPRPGGTLGCDSNRSLRRSEGEIEIAATPCTERRELAHRMNSEIEVTLFWSEAANRIIVEARDWRSDEAVEFEVDGDAALDAFNHPYAYAANSPRSEPRRDTRRGGSVVAGVDGEFASRAHLVCRQLGSPAAAPRETRFARNSGNSSRSLWEPGCLCIGIFETSRGPKGQRVLSSSAGRPSRRTALRSTGISRSIETTKTF